MEVGGVWEDDDEWPLLDWATNRAEEIMKVEAPARNDMADDDMADDMSDCEEIEHLKLL